VKAGDLIKMRSTGTMWLVVGIGWDCVLVRNIKTQWKGWLNKSAFEVSSAGR